MDNIMVFEGNNVEVFEFNGDVLFNPYDVGNCLGLSGVTVRRHMQEMNENQVVKLTNLDVQNMNIRKLNNAGENFLKEAGVYKLIFKSRKESAEKFQDWVTDEVLPTIRQVGGFVSEGREEEFVEKCFPSFSDEVKLGMVKDLMAQNKKLKENSDKYKAFMDEDGTFGWRELVKHLNGLGLNLKETEVRDLLKDKNIICKQGNKYVPSQSGVREGYGVIKDNIVNGINRPKSRYTVKLRDYLLNLFKGVA